MLTRDHVTGTLRAHLPRLAAQFGVRRIGLFGSYASGTATEDSDVDLVVEFDRPVGFGFVDLGEHLEQLLGARVDLLTPEGLRGIRIRRIAKSIEESIVYV